MTSKIKVNNIEDTSGNALVTKCGSTLTIGKSGDTISLASGASQTGFGRSGSVNWQTTPKTSTFTAVSGEGYFINSGSAITMNLPAGSAGAIVAVSDYARNFGTYNLTISPNGSEKIGGVAADAKLDVDGQSTTLVYVDSTKGWINVQNAEDTETGASFITATGGTITTVCTNFKVHTFTSPGTFTVSSLGSGSNNKVDYMVVAGGGGGSGMDGNNSQGGGGGGAGGFRESKTTAVSGCHTASPIASSTSLTVTASGFPITVGAGGTSGSKCAGGNTGSNSIFSSITSAGGGGVTGGDSGNGKNGGSGGGANANCGNGGTGNTPPVSPAQGTDGGDGNSSGPKYGAGGGGGATGAGGNGVSSGTNSGLNGTGATTSINGSAILYAEGGGGANYNAPSSPPNHSQGVGGNAGYGGYPGGNACGQAGTTNRGGGGGGGSAGDHPQSSNGGAGGSGIVIIRYRFQ